MLHMNKVGGVKENVSVAQVARVQSATASFLENYSLLSHSIVIWSIFSTDLERFVPVIGTKDDDILSCLDLVTAFHRCIHRKTARLFLHLFFSKITISSSIQAPMLRHLQIAGVDLLLDEIDKISPTVSTENIVWTILATPILMLAESIGAETVAFEQATSQARTVL